MTLAHRIAIITGASSGIGEATARLLVASGCQVVGNARRGDKLAQMEETLGPAFVGVTGDAADPALIQQLFATCETRFQRAADIVIVNAGRGSNGALKDTDLTGFEAILKLNVAGAAQLMQEAARRFVIKQKTDFPAKAADIVVIGSVVGKNVSPFGAAYSATKFAVHALAESLRRDVGPQGVRVSLVQPGVVISGFQEQAGYAEKTLSDFQQQFGPLLQPDDIAEAIAFIVRQPPQINVSEIVVRPTRQAYP